MDNAEKKKRGCILGCIDKTHMASITFIVYYDTDIKKYVMIEPKQNIITKKLTFEDIIKEIKQNYTIETVS